MTQPPELTHPGFRLQIRKLREQAVSAGGAAAAHTVLVTGMDRRHGVTTIATNLAYDLRGLGGSRPLLITNQPQGKAGEANLASADEGFGASIAPAPPNGLAVASAGWDDPSASSGGTGGLREALPDLQKRFSHIVIDAPPMTRAPAVLGLVGLADLTVLVVRANRSRWQAVARVKDLIQGAKPRSVGIVINRRRLYIPRLLYGRT